MWPKTSTSAGCAALAETLSRVLSGCLGRISLNLGSPKNFASFKVQGPISACGRESTLIECETLDQGMEGGLSELLLWPAEWSSSSTSTIIECRVAVPDLTPLWPTCLLHVYSYWCACASVRRDDES